MPNVLKKVLVLLTGVENPFPPLTLAKKRPLGGLTERELIQLESDLGRDLFGPVPEGHQREFFCLDAKTWIWYEEYVDPQTKKKKSSTTRYELQENRILKAQEGARYSYLEGEELQNLLTAIQMYYEQVARKVYKREPYSGQKLT